MERDEKDHIDDDLRQVNDIIFGEPDTPKNIEIETATERILAISFAKLIERLTSKSAIDQNLLTNVFLTYRGFQSPKILLLALIKRFFTAPEEDQAVIQLRVLSIIQIWISTYWSDFKKDLPTLLPILQRFLDKCSKSGQISIEALFNPIDNISVTLASQLKLESKSDLVSVNNDFPCSIIENSDPIELLDVIQPNELAEQLTLYNWATWSKIQPNELVNLAWTKKGQEERSPNILKFIRMFNLVRQWVSMSILTVDNLATRIKRLEYWILTAKHLVSLNDLNSAIAVLDGWQSIPVFRLEKTFQGINEECKNILDMLSHLLNAEKSYKAQREHLQSIKPPCIPFLGMYMTDLTFIEYRKNHPSLITWSKYEDTAKVIQTVQKYQATPYQLIATVDLRQKIENFVFFSEVDLELCSFYFQPRQNQNPPKPFCLVKYQEGLQKKNQDK